MSSDKPPFVMRLTTNFDAWVVGSSAINTGTPPRDWDILVPWHRWHEATSMIPQNATPNSLGGWKFKIEGVEIDMWPGDLSWLAQQPKFKCARHPRTNTLITKDSQ